MERSVKLAHRRLHWWLILPAFHLLLYVGLWTMEFWPMSLPAAQKIYMYTFVPSGQWPDFTAAKDAVGFWPWSGRAAKTAFMINLPVTIVAYVLVTLFTGLVPQYYLYPPVLIAWLVPPFWYLVGRWIDRRMS